MAYAEQPDWEEGHSSLSTYEYVYLAWIWNILKNHRVDQQMKMHILAEPFANP